MALTIATNLFALNAQNALSNTQQPLAKAQEQLSTGLKINNASDNAAGLAIATRMQMQINGYSQDVNNANNGVDFAQTAEGALTGMTNNLQRIYELANQSASYNTSSDRADMNDEVQQLIAQLNSTVSQTEYNGSTFLNQNFSANFQTGTEVGQTINITTSNVAPNAFGVDSSVTDFSNDANAQTGIANAAASISLGAALGANSGLTANATLNSISMGASIDGSLILNNSQTIINRINQYTAQTNVTAFSFGNADVGSSVAVGTAAGGGTADLAAGYLTINGIAIGSVSLSGATAATNASQIAASINNVTSQTGVTAIVLGSAQTSAASSYSIALVNTSGGAITVSVATADVSTGGSSFVGFFGNNSIAAGQNGQIVYSTPLNATPPAVDAGDSNAFGFGANTTTAMTSQTINNIDITTVGGANVAILAVEQGINTMNNQQAYLGAVVNRFNSAVSSLQSDSTNITAARSSIMDADYAASTSNLTTSMITEQAGIAMLSQANTLPQQILSLLPKG